MKSILILLCLIPSLAIANDPFDKKQRHSSDKTNSQVETPHKKARCHESQQRVFPQLPFSQLKLVGILFAQQNQILLQGEQQEVRNLQVGELVAQEGYKLKQIDKQSAQFISWKNNCSEGNIISLSL